MTIPGATTGCPTNPGGMSPTTTADGYFLHRTAGSGSPVTCGPVPGFTGRLAPDGSGGAPSDTTTGGGGGMTPGTGDPPIAGIAITVSMAIPPYGPETVTHGSSYLPADSSPGTFPTGSTHLNRWRKFEMTRPSSRRGTCL